MNQLLDLILHPLAEILGGFARIIQGSLGLWVLWIFLGIPLWILWQGIITGKKDPSCRRPAFEAERG